MGYGRGRGIRTPDIQLPKLARYQTALYPVGMSVGPPSVIRHNVRVWMIRRPVDIVKPCPARRAQAAPGGEGEPHHPALAPFIPLRSGRRPGPHGITLGKSTAPGKARQASSKAARLTSAAAP